MALEPTCSVCGSATGVQAALGPFRDRRKGLAGAWMVRPCGACHVLRMDPLPTDEELSTYYAAYAQDDQVHQGRTWTSRVPRLRRAFHWLSGDVDPRDFVDAPAGSRVLDYGCGASGYLREFHERGVAITGVEIAAHLVGAGQRAGLDVRQIQGGSRLPFADAEFDVVYLMQVFEHLKEPQKFMEELVRVMKPGGVLYLALPNAASLWRRVFGANWVSGWFAPFHLFHYDRESLARLGNRHGLRPLKVWSRTPASWFRLNLKAWIHGDENRVDWRRSWLDTLPLRWALMLVLRLMELPLRERDCLVVHLQKGGSDES